MLIPRTVGYVVHVGSEHSKYPADTHRVTLEWGALVVYLRVPPVVCAGDSDIPLHTYGVGAWQGMDLLLEDV